MSNNSRSNTNSVVRSIRERLQQAQQAPEPPPQNEGGSGQLRVTKDGRFLGADDVAPDGTTVIPSATFHAEKE